MKRWKLGIVLAVAAAILGCESIEGAQRRDRPRLIRNADGAEAIVVWYMRGEHEASPPPEPDALIVAVWADGFALTRPQMLASELHVVQFDPAMVEQLRAQMWQAASTVPASERVAPALEAGPDGVVLVSGKEPLQRIALVGWDSAPDSLRAAAFDAFDAPMRQLLDPSGDRFDGHPAIRWELR